MSDRSLLGGDGQAIDHGGWEAGELVEIVESDGEDADREGGDVIDIAVVIFEEIVAPLGSVANVVDFIGPVLISEELTPGISVFFVFDHTLRLAWHEVGLEPTSEVCDSV